ncbi:MAG: SixA phosphatase family protein [Solirubrobacterales bacterium]
MALLLLRHAPAGSRDPAANPAEDRRRPLDQQGLRQAHGLPALYSGYDVERVLTSPYLRCRQSVEPLAAALGLPVEERAQLAEGAAEVDARALVEELAGSTAVLCTHGDVLILLLGEEPEKGETWVVEAGPAGSLRRSAYLPPPS